MAAPQRDHLIRIDTLRRLFTEEVLDGFLDGRHARHAAHQQNRVDIAGGQAGVLQCQPARLDGAARQIIDQAFQLGARQAHVQVLWPARVRSDKGQVDLGAQGGRKLDLRFLSRFFQALQRLTILPQVNAVFPAELIGYPIDDAVVEVVSAQVGIAVGRLDFKDAVRDLKNRNIKGAAAQVIDRDNAFVAFAQDHMTSSTPSAR